MTEGSLERLPRGGSVCVIAKSEPRSLNCIDDLPSSYTTGLWEAVVVLGGNGALRKDSISAKAKRVNSMNPVDHTVASTLSLLSQVRR